VGADRFITPLLFTAQDPEDTNILCVVEHGIIETPASETVLEHLRAAAIAWLKTDDGQNALEMFHTTRKHAEPFPWNEVIHEMPAEAWSAFGLKLLHRYAVDPQEITGLHSPVIQ